MQNFELHKIKDDDRPWVKRYIKGHWGSSLIIVHGLEYESDKMEGFYAIDKNGKKIGLATYHIKDQDCQIVTLNSDAENQGVGSTLLNAVKNTAIDKFCKRLWLITTNDNIEALRFYQKFGFVITGIKINEVERSRVFKPEIPKIGLHDIPIRDEIELEYLFRK
jgi:ribosomal protein S18 acetylase RimI-like enzyme